MEDKTKKICLAASAGGHLTQLLKLADSWRKYEAIYVSTSQIVFDRLTRLGRTYIVEECNRAHLFKSMKVLINCFHIARKERPDYVLSTGAEPGFLMCMTAKLFGAKIIMPPNHLIYLPCS